MSAAKHSLKIQCLLEAKNHFVNILRLSVVFIKEVIIRVAHCTYLKNKYREVLETDI